MRVTIVCRNSRRHYTNFSTKSQGSSWISLSGGGSGPRILQREPGPRGKKGSHNQECHGTNKNRAAYPANPSLFGSHGVYLRGIGVFASGADGSLGPGSRHCVDGRDEAAKAEIEAYLLSERIGLPDCSNRWCVHVRRPGLAVTTKKFGVVHLVRPE